MTSAVGPLPVIVNRGGGTASRGGDSLRGKLEDAFARAGRPVAIEIVAGEQLPAALARHAGSPRVVVGGGDGTLNAAAQAFAGSPTELAILSLGTLNHFAGQLGVPDDLDEAAALASGGSPITIDIGEVGDRIFLNNASLGAYVDMVHERDATKLPKVLGSLLAGADVLRRLRARRYDLTLDGTARTIATVQLFVGNNRYEVDEGRPARRASLCDGLLSVFATAPVTRLGLVRTAFRVALGKADPKQDFALDADVRELKIGGSGSVGLAIDGEALTVSLPLVLRSRPLALKVVAPANGDAAQNALVAPAPSNYLAQP